MFVFFMHFLCVRRFWAMFGCVRFARAFWGRTVWCADRVQEGLALQWSHAARVLDPPPRRRAHDRVRALPLARHDDDDRSRPRRCAGTRDDVFCFPSCHLDAPSNGCTA